MDISTLETKQPFNGARLSTETATKKAKLRAENPLGHSKKNQQDAGCDTAQAEDEKDGGIQETYE